MIFRWTVLVALIGAVGVSTYHRRRARMDGGTIPRRSEGMPLLVGRVLVALPLFLGVLTYAAKPDWMAWASFSVPTWLRWVGVAFGLLCVPAVHWVLSALGRNVSETVLTKRDHELVTGGPYRWVRHPLYTTGVILFVAIGLMAANWFILSMAFVVLFLIRIVVVPSEERMLLETFGEDYRRYMRATGRFLPLGFRAPHPTSGIEQR